MLENTCICMKFDLLHPLLVDWLYIVYFVIIQFSQFYHGYTICYYYHTLFLCILSLKI